MELRRLTLLATLCCGLTTLPARADVGDPQVRTAEVTEAALPEYAVYTLFSDFTVRRTAENFWRFVTEFCLGEKHDQLVKGLPAKQVFMPVGP